MVNWNTSREVPQMPPEEVVPSGAVEALRLVVAADKEQRRLRQRHQTMGQTMTAARRKFEAATMTATRAGEKGPRPTALLKLEEEQAGLPAQIQAARQAHLAVALDFGAVCEPLLDEHRHMALESLRSDLVEIEKDAAALDRKIEQAGELLGIVQWADTFERTPRYAPRPIIPARDGVAATLAEARRLIEYTAAEMDAVEVAV